MLVDRRLGALGAAPGQSGRRGLFGRDAVTERGGRTKEVENLVRRLENAAERSSRGRIAPDLSWIRAA